MNEIVTAPPLTPEKLKKFMNDLNERGAVYFNPPTVLMSLEHKEQLETSNKFFWREMRKQLGIKKRNRART